MRLIVNKSNKLINKYRILYKKNIEKLCELANVLIVDKLNDEEFDLIRKKAYENNSIETSIVTDNINYYLFQLQLLDSKDAWERIYGE